MMINLSISDLLKYRTCPYSFVLSKTVGWAGASPAMRRGTMLHLALESKLSGEDPGPFDLSSLSSGDASFVEKGLERLKYWGPPFQVRATEHPLSFQFSGFQLVGRLDALVEDSGLWSLQLKTVGKGKSLGNKLEEVRTSPHEVAYHWLAAKAGLDLKGTILLTLKDLNKDQAQAGLDMLQLTHLPRDLGWVESAFFRDIFPDLVEMSELVSGLAIQRDYTSCHGDFGNSLCPAYDHCHNDVPVSALGLIVQEDRYQDLKGDSQ